MKNRLICLITLLLMLILSSVAFADSYNQLRTDYLKLSQSSQLQRQRANWERLIKRFDRFIERNPHDRQLDKVTYLRARTQHGLSRASGSRGDASAAMQLFVAVANDFPRSNLADDALYNAGQISEHRLKDITNARLYYLRLVTRFPQGDMVDDAHTRLATLPGAAVVEPSDHSAVTNNEDSDYNQGQAPTLEKVRYWSGPEYTRIVFDLNAPVVARPHYLKGDSPRLYFDLLYTVPAKTVAPRTSIGNGLVKQVRSALFDEQRTRVVIDLDRVAEYRLTNLKNPYRLVVDILGAPTRAANPSIQSPQSGNAGDDSIATILESAPADQPQLHIPQKSGSDGIKLIVVDAGHGGKDPGAVGYGKLYEKNVVLPMAKYLAESLRKKMGVKVLLTRPDDRFIELRERTRYANRVGADLFVSLHMNASTNKRVNGVETYFLNLSKNKQAVAVAARENGTTMEEVSNLEAILFDLMANAKINESSRLAAEIQQALIAGLRRHYKPVKDLGVKQGPFHVLLGATMPSVLVEGGFVSNSTEAKRMKTKKYQQRVADSIAAGIVAYAKSMNQVAKR